MSVEVPILSDPVMSGVERPTRTVSAFRVLREGDCLLAEPMSELRGGILVLVEVRGHQVLRRLPQSAEGLADSYAAGLSLQSERAQIAGSLNQGNTTERAAAKLEVLRSEFGMLESTLAVTRNPRLHRALRAEAHRARC